jgi:hypothetical protein
MQPNAKQLVREPLKVTVFMRDYKVTGTIYLSVGERLSDFLNAMGNISFLPITDARVESLGAGTKVSYQSHFLTLSTKEIILISPHDEEAQEQEKTLIQKLGTIFHS